MDGSIDNVAIPAGLLEQVRARAAAERRSAGDIVREAVEDYLHGHAPPQEQSDALHRSPQEAVARLLERRKHNVLPEGVTIRDLMTYGRA